MQRVRLEKTDNNLIYLTTQELNSLFEQVAKEQKDKIIKARDKAMLELFACTGLKVSEIVKLTQKNVNLNEKVLNFDNRVLNLTNQSVKHIGNYLKLGKIKGVDYLFVSHDRAKGLRKKQRISERTVQRMVERIAKNAGIKKKVTPQVLRNTFLMNCVKQGDNLDEIKEKFGFISDNFLYNLTKLK